MRKGVREKTEVPVKILVNSTRETNILARENIYKNVPVKSQKCAWKNFFDLWKLYSYIQFLTGYQIIFCHWVEKVEKKYKTGEKNEISPRETRFLPVKKNQTSAREKKRGREKNGKKCAWKHRPAREKTQKRQKKWVSRALLSFTGKKKTLTPTNPDEFSRVIYFT